MDPDDDPIRTRRVQYETAGLDVADLAADPVEQFLAWHRAAFEAGVAEPNAMVVATVAGDGTPSARAVLMRGADARGLTFFTNYDSPKSIDLMSNSKVAATFLWADLHRQIRIVGLAEQIASAESDAYFASRPRASRIGAWASPQSRVLSGRSELDELVARRTAQFGAEIDIPRPPNWGGWRIVPTTYEFWQGRPDRLHDRLRYRRPDHHGSWLIERLAP